VYTGDGVYTVTLTVTDEDGGADAATMNVEVFANVPPIVDVGEDETIDEGGSLLQADSFTDPDVGDLWSATVDYGDGASPRTLALDGQTFQLEHVYVEDGTYEVTVTVTDSEGESGSDSLTVTVLNAAPIITDLTNSSPSCGGAGEGDQITLSAAFTDAGALDTHTAVVDWGDGSDPETLAVTEVDGSGTVAAAHVFARGGIYTITLTVADDDGAETTATTAAVISGVGLHDGVLQIIGTTEKDHVRVKQWHGDLLRVEASFMDGDKHRLFDANSVTRIEVYLCEGADHLLIQDRIVIPAEIHAGGGNDQVHGGGGDDIIWSGGGTDHLRGRGGNDQINGAADDEFDTLWPQELRPRTPRGRSGR